MDKAERIAEKLAADWLARAPYQTLSGDLAPADLDESYRAQAAVQERLSHHRGPIAGRKIALSSKAMQQMVGIGQPVAGAFFRDDIRWSPATVPASAFRHLGVEFELAVELASDVPPQEKLHDSNSVRSLIAAVRPAFELIEDRGADYAALDALTLVADNAWCGGVILGEAIDNWEKLDLGDLPATVHQAGAEPERANTGAADPLASLAWVLTHLGARGLTARKGEHVITGSAVRTRFPAPGDRLRYEIDGLAEVSLSIA